MPQIRTAKTQAVEPFFIWEQGFKRVHVAMQIMGNLYICACGTATDEPVVPDNATVVRDNMVCLKCRQNTAVSLDTIRANTLRMAAQIDGVEVPSVSKTNQTPERKGVFFVNLVGHSMSILDYNCDKLLGLRPDEHGRKAIVYRDFKTRRDAYVPNSNVMIKDILVDVVLELPNGDLDEFPAPKAGTVYVVPSSCLGILQRQGRTDVYAPGPIKRDGAGSILGCIGLSRLPEGEA